MMLHAPHRNAARAAHRDQLTRSVVRSRREARRHAVHVVAVMHVQRKPGCQRHGCRAMRRAVHAHEPHAVALRPRAHFASAQHCQRLHAEADAQHGRAGPKKTGGAIDGKVAHADWRRHGSRTAAQHDAMRWHVAPRAQVVATSDDDAPHAHAAQRGDQHRREFALRSVRFGIVYHCYCAHLYFSMSCLFLTLDDLAAFGSLLQQWLFRLLRSILACAISTWRAGTSGCSNTQAGSACNAGLSDLYSPGCCTTPSALVVLLPVPPPTMTRKC